MVKIRTLDVTADKFHTERFCNYVNIPGLEE